MQIDQLLDETDMIDNLLRSQLKQIQQLRKEAQEAISESGSIVNQFNSAQKSFCERLEKKKYERLGNEVFLKGVMIKDLQRKQDQIDYKNTKDVWAALAAKAKQEQGEEASLPQFDESQLKKLRENYQRKYQRADRKRKTGGRYELGQSSLSVSEVQSVAEDEAASQPAGHSRPAANTISQAITLNEIKVQKCEPIELATRQLNEAQPLTHQNSEPKTHLPQAARTSQDRSHRSKGAPETQTCESLNNHEKVRRIEEEQASRRSSPVATRFQTDLMPSRKRKVLLQIDLIDMSTKNTQHQSDPP